MIDVRNVLCPVDRSDISRRAMIFAGHLAEWYDARLRLMEVVSVPLPPLSMGPVAVHGLTLDTRRAILDELDRFAEPARAFGVPIHVTVEEGDIVTAILEEAKALPADLLVLGTHGRGGFERFALGSVAEKILRKARCPVLTVPPGDRAQLPSEAPFKTILCAVDFSAASLKGVEYALSLAQEADARLIVTHVIDWPDEANMAASLADALVETRRELEEEKRRQLSLIVPDDARTWCRPEERLLIGAPAHEIVKLAHETSAEVIVMGVHGRSGIDIALFGSTTQRVVRDAPCPVLTVRTGR